MILLQYSLISTKNVCGMSFVKEIDSELNLSVHVATDRMLWVRHLMFCTKFSFSKCMKVLRYWKQLHWYFFLQISYHLSLEINSRWKYYLHCQMGLIIVMELLYPQMYCPTTPGWEIHVETFQWYLYVSGLCTPL